MFKLLLYTVFALPLLVPAGASAAIYKSVDEDGNVVFSDQPSPGAEKIEKKEIPTVPSQTPEVDFSGDRNDAGQEKRGEGRGYDNIRIVSPEDESAIRNNAGNLSVSVNISPALREGHEIVLYMDGQEAGRSRSPVFQFSNVDRGTHNLTAAVVNAEGSEVGRSEPVSFTLHRHSVQHPKAKTPGVPQAPQPSGPTPTNPPQPGPTPPSPSGPTPTNPPTPSP